MRLRPKTRTCYNKCIGFSCNSAFCSSVISRVSGKRLQFTQEVTLQVNEVTGARAASGKLLVPPAVSPSPASLTVTKTAHPALRQSLTTIAWPPLHCPQTTHVACFDRGYIHTDPFKPAQLDALPVTLACQARPRGQRRLASSSPSSRHSVEHPPTHAALPIAPAVLSHTHTSSEPSRALQLDCLKPSSLCRHVQGCQECQKCHERLFRGGGQGPQWYGTDTPWEMKGTDGCSDQQRPVGSRWI
ncbi:hypothetical protein BDV96DRAFT_573805 [Lophiotrema nucula]|uniref:Uncharacterized protein n=1 Tax=Lophiotrema nucula TaxID=690887 RepID=A0A6A5ZAP3_9PLEO|nr:hypothetical protein BDV96DRAFT_573805 [Lophiotrema nucula]